jgi:hypothetical protein
MSDTENRPQDQESEEESSTDEIPTLADPSDPIGGEGDPPIIIQGGGSGNPG